MSHPSLDFQAFRPNPTLLYYFNIVKGKVRTKNAKMLICFSILIFSMNSLRKTDDAFRQLGYAFNVGLHCIDLYWK